MPFRGVREVGRFGETSLPELAIPDMKRAFLGAAVLPIFLIGLLGGPPRGGHDLLDALSRALSGFDRTAQAQAQEEAPSSRESSSWSVTSAPAAPPSSWSESQSGCEARAGVAASSPGPANRPASQSPRGRSRSTSANCYFRSHPTSRPHRVPSVHET